jgi:CelD/BcsL family acetyltransferase involved in cellulose biosynthesis
MTIKVVTSLDELFALRPVWQTLFASNENHTPFQSWEWHYAWWKHFGRPGALRILIAESRGKVLGIAPLCLSSTFRGWPLKHLTFISRKRSDYLDFLVQPGAETEFFTELFAFIKARRADWRFIDLSDLQQSSSNCRPF